MLSIYLTDRPTFIESYYSYTFSPRYYSYCNRSWKYQCYQLRPQPTQVQLVLVASTRVADLSALDQAQPQIEIVLASQG